jgi:hypothetical protein
MWQVYGDQFSTSEMTDTTKSALITFDKNEILIATRIWIVIYNNPTFTSLNMKIYSNDNGSPKKLIATSTNVQLKADVHTLDNAIKEIWFEFNKVNVKEGDSYHFVLNGSGYTGSDSSHIAWKKAFPDPVYSWGVVTLPALGRAPYDIYCIGADY